MYKVDYYAVILKFLVKNMRIKVTLTILIVMIFLLEIAPIAKINAKPNKIPVTVTYTLKKIETKNLMLRSGESKDFSPIPSPTGYNFKWMLIEIPGGFPNGLIAIGYSKKIEKDGNIIGVASLSNKIKLVNQADVTLNVTVKIINAFEKEEEVSTTNKSVMITTDNIASPFSIRDLTIEVSTDNYLPYIISDLKYNGKSMLALSEQEKYQANAISVDPHHLRLDFSKGLPAGSYEVIMSKSDNAVYPSAFLVTENKFFNRSIKPYTKIFVSSNKTSSNETSLLGYAVILYNLNPFKSSKSAIDIAAKEVDYVYSQQQIITTDSASYLIPPIKFSFWIKAFIVYDKEFTVKNNGEYTVNMLYIPIFMRKIGVWDANGLTAEVTPEQIKDARFAYLVVQLPNYGEIADVITPKEVSVNEYVNSVIFWGINEREISVLNKEMYIQVKNDEISETGVYRVKINWKSFTIKTVDHNGKPLANAEIIAEGPTTISALTDQNGKATLTLYEPGVYSIKVMFKGATVYETTSLSLKSSNTFSCSVYDVKVTITSLLGQKIANVKVTITSTTTGSLVGDEATKESGSVTIPQIPKGTYNIEATYKGINSKLENVTVDLKHTSFTLSLNMLFQIPIVNVPVTLTSATIFFAVIGVTAFLISRRKSGKSVESTLTEEIP